MQYYILPTDQDLQHKAHKYVERRMGKNGKWIYYYTKKPSLKGRAGVYAEEKLHNQKLKSTVKLAQMPNNSREQAEAKMTQRHIEEKKIEKAQTDYNRTALGKLEKFATAGMNYLERLGLVTTRTKITTSNITIPKSSDFKTTKVSTTVPSSSGLITKTTKRRRLRDRR